MRNAKEITKSSPNSIKNEGKRQKFQSSHKPIQTRNYYYDHPMTYYCRSINVPHKMIKVKQSLLLLLIRCRSLEFAIGETPKTKTKRSEKWNRKKKKKYIVKHAMKEIHSILLCVLWPSKFFFSSVMDRNKILFEKYAIFTWMMCSSCMWNGHFSIQHFVMITKLIFNDMENSHHFQLLYTYYIITMHWHFIFIRLCFVLNVIVKQNSNACH